MLVYRSDSEERPGADVWGEIGREAASLAGHSDHDQIIALLISLGEAEAAIVDRLFPESDGIHPVGDALRAASVTMAHVVLASMRQDRPAVERHSETVRRRLDAIHPHAIPKTLSLPVSEGYAYYALRPESYAAAAQQYLRDSTPPQAVVIGIRSIGTSLSAMVAACLETARVPVRNCSVRPRGHPFDRHLAIDPALRAWLGQQPRGTAFLVVDEGPGLSGSSFAAVVRALADLDVEPADIVIFPSWNPDGTAFKSATARRIWQRHRRYCATDVPPPGTSSEPFSWRPLLYDCEDQWPASHPQHERLKWIAPRDAPQPVEIIRFAGLGHYGAVKWDRARTLAEHGLGPVPIGLRNGYLTMLFVAGRPCGAADVSPELLDSIAVYIAAVNRLFPRERRPSVDALQEMIETNVRLGVGDGALALAGLDRDERCALDEAPCAAIDARMLAHEWLRSPQRFSKVDALDHHTDHFLPGIQDAGWDLAAAAIEFGLLDAATERLIDAYVGASGDRDVRRRLPFHQRAYLAFRVGYATLARDSVNDAAEASRFAGQVRRYTARLTRMLEERSART